MEEFLTVSETAIRLGYSERRVRQLLEGEAIRGTKVGRRWHIPVSEINRFTSTEQIPEPRNSTSEGKLPLDTPPEEPGTENTPSLLVLTETSSEGYYLLSHASASSLEPIYVFFSLVYRGAEIIRFLRVHVWLLNGFVFWYPDAVDSDDWVDEGRSELPQELKSFFIEEYGPNPYSRWSLSIAPEKNFFLMPSSQSYGLPPLHLSFRSFIGVLAMPWQIECPGIAAATGTLLFWCDKDGRFHSESVGPEVDMIDLTRRRRRFLIKNGVTEMPR